MNDSWGLVKLSEVCNLQNGFAFKSKDYVKSSNTMNFRMSQIRPGGGIDLDNNPKYLPDDYAEIYKDYLLKDGDIVIAMTDMAAETKILGVPTIIKRDNRKLLLNQRVGKLYDIKQKMIYLPFLRYILTSPQINSYYKSLGRGGLQINIGKKDILKAKIPLPPLPEQKHIVAILDEAFAGIEKACVNTENNIKNSAELYESYFDNVFKNKQDCVMKDIGEICELMTGGTPKTTVKEYFVNGDINWIVSGDIHKKEILDCDKKITKLGLENSNAKYLPENSVLIALNGQGKTRGTVAMLKVKATCNQSIVSIFPNDMKTLNPKYLYHYLNGRYKYIRSLTGDKDRRGLNMPLIRKIKLPLTSIKNQNKIINNLDELSGHVKNLESIYKQKQAKLIELKRSILQIAFAGELH